MEKNNFLLIFVFLFILNCNNAPDTIKKSAAYKDLYLAIETKKRECNSVPDKYLVLKDDPIQEHVQICAYSILDMTCPFFDYPILCLKIYNVNTKGTGF